MDEEEYALRKMLKSREPDGCAALIMKAWIYCFALLMAVLKINLSLALGRLDFMTLLASVYLFCAVCYWPVKAWWQHWTYAQLAAESVSSGGPYSTIDSEKVGEIIGGAKYSILHHMDFRGLKLPKNIDNLLTRKSLEFTRFCYSNLSGMNFSTCNLHGVDIRRAKIEGWDITGADLQDLLFDQSASEWLQVKGLSEARNLPAVLMTVAVSEAYRQAHGLGAKEAPELKLVKN